MTNERGPATLLVICHALRAQPSIEQETRCPAPSPQRPNPIAALARNVLATVAAAFVAGPGAQDALQQRFSGRRLRVAERVRARFARR